MSGIMFEESIDLDPLKSSGGNTFIIRGADAIRRRRQHIPLGITAVDWLLMELEN